MNTQATQNTPFPKGDKAPAEYFTGTAWVKLLVPNDDAFNCQVGNVITTQAHRIKLEKKHTPNEGCLGCGLTENITLSKKTSGIGEGFGLYDRIILGKKLALNFELGITQIKSTYLYQGPYKSSGYFTDTTIQTSYGYEYYKVKVNLLNLSPNIGIIFYLNKNDENNYRLYCKLGISANVYLKDNTSANITTYDTILYKPGSSQAMQTTVNSYGFFDFGLVNAINFQPDFSVGFQTPESKRLHLHFEVCFFQSLTDYIVPFPDLKVNGLIFKAGVSFK